MPGTPTRSPRAVLTTVVTTGCLLLSTLAVPLTASAAATSSSDAQKVIVIFDAAPAAEGLDLATRADRKAADGKRSTVRGAQKKVLAAASSAGVAVHVDRSFDTVLNGVSATVSAAEITALEKVPGVARVVPDLPVHAMEASDAPMLAAGAPTARTAAATAGTGAGVTVAVIDTGVDYTHPDLGAGFGPDHKVIGGYDFVDDDADPMDDNGHGTHVAGIVAGRAASAGGVTGAAPDALITAYKAMDASGNGDSSDIVAAIEAAIDPAGPHPAQVINMSLGVDGGSGDDPVTMAAQAAADAGVIVVASAGNAGPVTSSVASPAVAPGVIAVAASQGDRRVGGAKLGDEKLQTYEAPMSSAAPEQATTGRLVDVGFGSAEEVSAAGDLTGAVALMNGFASPDPANAPFMDREAFQRIQEAGAIAVLVGPDAGSGGGGIGIGSAPSGFTISAEDGSRMSSLVVLGMDDTQYAELNAAAHEGRQVTVTGTDVSGEIAPFSARGPVNDGTYRLKPDVAAPGVDIVSTVPTAIVASGYAALSGTSMASPAVAGAAAVMRERFPDRPASEIRSALIGASDPLAAPPTTDGAGRLDLGQALASPLEITPTSISGGLADLDAKTISTTKTIALHNTGSNRLGVKLAAKGVSVRPASVSLAPGETREVKVTISAARTPDAQDVSGDLVATFSGGRMTVPYLLVARPLGVYVNVGPQPALDVVGAQPFDGAVRATLTGPDGKEQTLTLESRGPAWAGISLDGVATAPGRYSVSASAVTTSGTRLVGSTAFEVPGGAATTAWTATGPNSIGGQVTTSPDDSTAVTVPDGSVLPWVSTDEGSTWTPRPGAPLAASLGKGHIVFDPAEASRFWFAVNECIGGCGTIVRTDDLGKTWMPQFLGNEQIIELLALADGTVVAVTPASLIVSTDGGTTWETHGNGIAGEAQYAAALDDALYLADGRSIWKVPMTGGAPGTAILSYSSTTTVFVTALTSGDGFLAANVWLKGALVTSDGATWSTAKAGSFLDTVRASGDALYVADNGKGQLSSELGGTWSEVGKPRTDAVVTDFDVWDGAPIMSDSSGVYRLADGEYRRIGVAAATVDDLMAVEDRMLAATETGMYSSPVADPTMDWGVGGGEGRIGLGVDVLAQSQGVLWRVGTDAFAGIRTERSDDGTTWTEVDSTDTTPTAFWVDPADAGHAITAFVRPADGARGIRVTKDGGQTWKNIYTGLYVEAIDADESGRLLLGTPNGLFRSSDGGATSTKVLDGRIRAIERSGKYLVAAGDTISVSTKDGRWTTADLGGVPTSIGDVVMTDNAWFAAGEDFFWGVPVPGRGVLTSTDEGRTWKSVGAALPTSDVRSLAVSSDGAWLYVGLGGAGTYRTAIE